MVAVLWSLGWVSFCQEDWANVQHVLAEAARLFAATQNTSYVAEHFVTAAAAALAGQQPDVAAQLLGAFKRHHLVMQNRPGWWPQPLSDEAYAQLETQAKAQLGHSTYQQQWAVGEQWRIDVAVEALTNISNHF